MYSDGFCGLESFMSSDPEETGIYIQWIHDVDDENNGSPRGRAEALIADGEVQSMEFRPNASQGFNDDRDRQTDRPAKTGCLGEGISAQGRNGRQNANLTGRTQTLEWSGISGRAFFQSTKQG